MATVSAVAIEEQPKTIWQELDAWAADFKPWQRFALSHAVRFGQLNDEQIDQTYRLFLHDCELADQPDPPIEVPTSITDRPNSLSLNPILLKGLSKLSAVNALTTKAELSFCPGLTVIYGGNGAGKSGFARVLSNSCFSRNQTKILPNVYADEHPPSLAAEIIIDEGNGKETTIQFNGVTQHPELKRIAVFDSVVARTHLVEQNPLGFKPVGFDVFTEMARVYGKLAEQLTRDIQARTRENQFPKSFLEDSKVAQLVAEPSLDSNLDELRTLASFTDAEIARLQEVQRQITELQSQSVQNALSQLNEAGGDVAELQEQLGQALVLLEETKRVEYRALLSTYSDKMAAVAARGAESFKAGFFQAIATPEWEAFLNAASALGTIENAEYPRDTDHCLLCYRPLDGPSILLIRRFWDFLASDVRQEAEAAKTTLDIAAAALSELHFGFFADSTTVRAHIERLNPPLTKQIDSLVSAMEGDRDTLLKALQDGTGDIPQASLSDVSKAIEDLIAQIQSDILRLSAQNTDDALKGLEAERIELRHRQVLSQLFPDIEKFADDSKWAAKASDAPKRSLNPRHITEKETELFGTVIAESYRSRLADECKALDCALPIEFCTQGQRGQTLRSLRIKGSIKPDEVLSEGEQRAVALADFLTEVALNPASAGIVFDDPVNSQDHQRKQRVANRLAEEAKSRQVIVFTHDLVFLSMLIEAAEKCDAEILTHWVQRDGENRPGQVALGDCPAGTPDYLNTNKATKTLTEAKAASGLKQHQLIQRGMGELRRTIEEIVPHLFFKQVVKRWSDRVMVTSLKKIKWDDALVADIIKTFEDLSIYIEGHSHTEEASGSPPAPKDLEDMIGRVADIIKKAKPDKTN